MVGECPNCQAWNSFLEQVLRDQSQYASDKKYHTAERIIAVGLSRLLNGSGAHQRIQPCMGGGIVPGSLILIGAETRHRQIDIIIQASRN